MIWIYKSLMSNYKYEYTHKYKYKYKYKYKLRYIYKCKYKYKFHLAWSGEENIFLRSASSSAPNIFAECSWNILHAINLFEIFRITGLIIKIHPQIFLLNVREIIYMWLICLKFWDFRFNCQKEFSSKHLCWMFLKYFTLEV